MLIPMLERGSYVATGRPDLAADCFRKAIALLPGYAAAHKNLGQIHQQQGDYEAAIACFEEALAQHPKYAPAHVAWGDLLYARGDLLAAANQYQRALAISDEPGVRLLLANTLDGLGHHLKAVELFRSVASTDPDYPGLQNDMGLALVKLGEMDEAVACYERAIAANPGNPVPHNSLGNAYTQMGWPGESIRCFRAALSIKPDYAKTHSNLLLNMNYIEDEQEEIHPESLRFDRQQVGTLTDAAPPFSNTRSIDRKLRIGYVSGDFRSHSVAYFLLPLLEAHDRDRFEVICYSSNARRDDVTERFERLADDWVKIRGTPDDRVAERIRRDEIDILVDLSGHTNDNRLMVFARKPAPVQVSWLGYPNTTGLRAMDYRITDELADPAGDGDCLYTEKLIRLPGGFICYQRDVHSPAAPAPADASGRPLTFGSFNTLGKVTAGVVDTWAELLNAIPGSRLVLKAQALAGESTRASVVEQFAERNVAPERLDLLGLVPSKTEHFRSYSKIDIALDTFPYNGTTTTCEALWMGVPVVSLSGSHHAGRVGASILHRVGLADLTAHDRASYVSLALGLARDEQRRGELRSGLRGMMQGSALMDQPGFASEMEDAYRSMWSAWCGESDGDTRVD